MANTFVQPKRESELVTWSQNFRTGLTTLGSQVGVSSAQSTAYGLLHDAFAAAYLAVNSDSSNSSSAVIVKNNAKDALLANARLLAGIIQTYPGTTDELRSDLGLTVKDIQPSPIPAPDVAPGLLLQAVEGNTVYLRLLDADNPNRRGKPDGVDGATVLSYVGPSAPAHDGDWNFVCNTARTTAEITFPATLAPASKVWITAFWFNARKERGPAATPLTTTLLGSAALAA